LVVHNLGLCGPTFAALILSGLLSGRSGVSGLLKRILIWRVAAGWWIFAVFFTLAAGLAARGISFLVSGSVPELNLNIFWVQLLLLPSGLPEEFGWRGFALPQLLRKRTALASSLIIALFWVLWHIPISPILNNGMLFAIFMLEVVPLSILFNWLYINSRGSVLLVVIFHFFYNTWVYILNIPGSRTLWIVYISLTWILVMLVMFRYGPARLSAKAEPDLKQALEI
jgi:hypothetical protein